ncbi:MAG: COX15/CtaA family protein [Planctomycetota bacterium]|jgi:cytochrome c oxidase assembly protein subunit 15|nr:COX15/CtaA family protein [Planctomycetota bacterium]
MTTTDTTLEQKTTSSRASIASWLGVLFVLVLLLMMVGGYVRLTQSGLSLPGWPFVEGRVLPPMSDAGWHEMHELYQKDMHELESRRQQGIVGLGASGHRPETLADFQRIFLIEWSHRFLAALVGMVGLACMVVMFRNRDVRELAGKPLVGIVGLIVVQSIIGGLLVLSHTSTHWLFIHLGIATGILGFIMWTLMLLVRGRREPLPKAELAPRRTIRFWVRAALIVTFIQIVLGAFVAGSRHNGFSTSWPEMAGEIIPTLWMSSKGVIWNLLDNPTLHQWTHRWFAWIVVIAIAAMASTARRAPIGMRGRLAIRFAFAVTCAQIILGVMNVLRGAELVIAMSHLAVALVLFTSLCLAAFDLRYEPTGEREALGDAGRIPA